MRLKLSRNGIVSDKLNFNLSDMLINQAILTITMLVDKEFSPNNPYKYGSAWLYREIPDKDIKEIKSIITKYKKDY